MPRKSPEIESSQSKKDQREQKEIASKQQERHAHWREARCGLFWPIFLIVVGLVWLARNLGWLGPNFPWFPLALIAFGVYLLCHRTGHVRESKKQKSTE